MNNAIFSSRVRQALRVMLVLCLLPVSYQAQAQWRLGLTGGGTWNHYSINKQYMTDYRYVDEWGGMAGVTTQYNFFEWLGLRAELNFVQRNYRHTRYEYADNLSVRYENNYLLLPVTVNFSFGGQRVRGFVNAGIYAGVWLSGKRGGTEMNSMGGGSAFQFSEPYHFNSEKDQRGDFGYTGGIGIEYRFHEHWLAQIEATCYYSIISTTKQYMDHQKDYRYNTTIGLKAGIAYVF